MQQYSRGQDSMQDTLQSFSNRTDDQDQESRDRVGGPYGATSSSNSLWGETNVKWYLCGLLFFNMRNDVPVLLQAK